MLKVLFGLSHVHDRRLQLAKRAGTGRVVVSQASVVAPLGFDVQARAAVAVQIKTAPKVGRNPVVLGEGCQVLLATAIEEKDGCDLALSLSVHPALRLSVLVVPWLWTSERCVLLEA